jgi:hypothetical protein
MLGIFFLAIVFRPTQVHTQYRGYFPGDKAAGGVNLTTSTRVLRLRIRGALPPLPQYNFTAWHLISEGYVFIAWYLVKHKG